MSEWGDPKVVLALVSMIFSAGVAVYAWFTKRQSATQAEIADLRKSVQRARDDFEKRSDGLSDRIAHLEGWSHSMPSKDQITELTVSLTALAGDLKGLTAQFTGMEKQIGQIGSSVEMLVKHEIQGGGND